jgi:hypothetical protein
MGLFEHCELLIEKKLLDIETFKVIFEYRLSNIIANPIIVKAKLIDEKNSWWLRSEKREPKWEPTLNQKGANLMAPFCNHTHSNGYQ